MLSWNPPVTGKFGRMIEIYDPNPLLTFGGMGSKKLTGANIEYITNDDSHPGAQFSSQFRNAVKGEVATLAAADRVEVAQAATPRPLALAHSTDRKICKPRRRRRPLSAARCGRHEPSRHDANRNAAAAGAGAGRA